MDVRVCLDHYIAVTIATNEKNCHALMASVRRKRQVVRQEDPFGVLLKHRIPKLLPKMKGLPNMYEDNHGM